MPWIVLAMDVHGAGPPLVLVHGVGTHRGVWRDVVGPLARDRRVIALDLPGFGDSPVAGAGFDLDRVSDVVAEAAAAPAGAPFDLLGHSLGGAVCLSLAARHPGALRSLVLLAPAGFSPRRATSASVLGLASPTLLALRRAVGVPLAGNPIARRALLWGAVARGDRMSPDAATFMLEASASARRLGDAVRAGAAANLQSVIASLEIPVGILWGERDRIVDGSSIDRIRAARVAAPVEVIPDVGHVPQLERPGAFCAALARLEARMQAVTD
jgi:pimeloyl-ACP methyl ester carboxylesterase